MYTGMNPTIISPASVRRDLLRIYGGEFAAPQLPKYASFLTDIDQKALSAKIYPAKMIHTGSVAEVQGEGKRLANNRNLLEKFSICPVYTGMSRIQAKSLVIFLNLPRIHGDDSVSPDQRG